ncbi:hypothetical protein AVEN_259691-1 [Araneus ventricosus]|uniref:Uncharacterized protein n=1 Tax=Araneus ventricosus TaxID=182803 RepID=A0A4Y2PKK8_ARAVE|nr:hypothetical protein AVEN_259691-1 [Araneus ventricosus]
MNTKALYILLNFRTAAAIVIKVVSKYSKVTMCYAVKSHIAPPGGMQKEEYEEWMSIDDDIPVAATLTDLKIRQAIKVDDSDGDECIEENPPTIAEMRQDRSTF